MKKKYVLILASGGLDSTALINFYKKIGFDIDLLFFDYGQVSKIKEVKAVTAISKFYNVNLIKVIIKSKNKYKGGLVTGRNALFYFLALMNFKELRGIIASGVHAGTGYYDCSEKFNKKIQILFDNYTDGTVKLGTPFLQFNKKEIWDYCQIEKVPIHLTYSCELGKKQPCGRCNTCKDLAAIYDSEK